MWGVAPHSRLIFLVTSARQLQSNPLFICFCVSLVLAFLIKTYMNVLAFLEAKLLVRAGYRSYPATITYALVEILWHNLIIKYR